MPDEQPKQSKLGWSIADRQMGADGLTITTHVRKERQYDVVATTDSFATIAYNRFDLAQVCRILLHDNPSFRGHKDALAAALCGWMLDLGEWVLRRRLVALSVGTTLAGAEQAATRQLKAQDITQHRYPRSIRLPPAFFDQLYDPIGGLRTIVRTPAHYGLYHELTSQRDRSYDTTMIAAIDHYHGSTMTNAALDDLSIERSCEVYVLVEMALNGCLPPNVANLKNHYLGGVERSLPFLYAASTIQLSETQTLLRAIAAGKWAQVLRPGVLLELLGRTLFYAQTVYMRNDRARNRVNIARDISMALRGVEPRGFDPPDRVTACGRIIEHGYTRAGYAASRTDKGNLRWNSPAFWSALDLPVPKYRGRARKSSV